MSKEKVLQKSLVEQILDKMFEELKGEDEFNDDIIKKLKYLAETQMLKNNTSVTKVIKSTLEG